MGGGSQDVRRAWSTVQRLFGERSSLDFIWARPRQAVAEWRSELDVRSLPRPAARAPGSDGICVVGGWRGAQAIFDLGSPHLSLYQLTLERGTPYVAH